MGCFLAACFGSSKDKKRRIQRHRVQHHRDQRYTSFEPVQSAVSPVPDVGERPTSPALEEVRDKPVEQLKPVEEPSFIARKKVTFDSNVKTYEHVSTNESLDLSLDVEECEKKEEGNILEKSTQSKSSSEDSSITSSSGSYPPNHRYQNCRDSDDEDGELDFEDSDLDDEDEDEDGYSDDDEELDYDDEIVESNRGISTPQVNTEDVDSPMPINPTGLNHNARDRSGYVHSVLNPVENLTQWKAVKAKGASLMKPQKENFTLDQEPRISFSSEASFKEFSVSFKSKTDQHKKQSGQSKNPNQEMAVDASLSNWLVSSENTPVNKTSTIALDTVTPEKSMSPGSNSARSHEDRPILGALTVEELRQFSASTSPRKSPSRSPDEMPIIGTVGTYWNHTGPAKGSAPPSYKGIPNTTSKYREDKRVNWHSTPFETRLERALNRGAAEAYSTHTSSGL